MSDHHRGLRVIAVFEAAKGGLVLLAGLGLLTLLHHRAEAVADEIVRHLRLNPAHAVPRIFLRAASEATDARLWLLSAGAVAYAAVRLAQAWGLWNGRRWAEWFGVVAGGIYLPVEVYELARHVTAVRCLILAVNVLVVWYLARTLRAERRPGVERAPQG